MSAAPAITPALEPTPEPNITTSPPVPTPTPNPRAQRTTTPCRKDASETPCSTHTSRLAKESRDTGINRAVLCSKNRYPPRAWAPSTACMNAARETRATRGATRSDSRWFLIATNTEEHNQKPAPRSTPSASGAASPVTKILAVRQRGERCAPSRGRPQWSSHSRRPTAQTLPPSRRRSDLRA